MHADDVFAGRDGRELPAWRRVYPRRRTAWTGRSDRGVRARLAEHPVLVSAVGGMLAVWAVVGVTAALTSHPARTHASSAGERGAEACDPRARHAACAEGKGRPRGGRTGAGSTPVHTTKRRRRAQHGRLPRERLRREA